MPVAKYVEKYGLAHFSKSMKAIEEITKRNTGEYAIRPYLEKYPKRTLVQLKKWSLSKNTHVRRLASEGLRPRLPWAKKLDIFVEDPDLIIPILGNLKDDPSKYVQKSVANCINDVLKDNLDRGKELIEEWNGKNISKERKWIIKHALPRLLKAKDTWAISIVDR
jgi:3-methyladenine DNA glycosylase AlkC